MRLIDEKTHNVTLKIVGEYDPKLLGYRHIGCDYEMKDCTITENSVTWVNLYNEGVAYGKLESYLRYPCAFNTIDSISIEITRKE